MLVLYGTLCTEAWVLLPVLFAARVLVLVIYSCIRALLFADKPQPLSSHFLMVPPSCTQLNMEVTRFAKTVGQVTRGLPDNAVVQKLKGMVDEFKATLPVIQAMRNPVLQKHHFTAIDEILGRDLSQEPEFTLGVLMDLKVCSGPSSKSLSVGRSYRLQEWRCTGFQ